MCLKWVRPSGSDSAAGLFGSNHPKLVTVVGDARIRRYARRYAVALEESMYFMDGWNIKKALTA